MRKSFIVGLLGAVALIPGTALAQDDGGDRGRFRAQREQSEGSPRFQRAEPAPRQFQPQQQQQPRPFQRPDRNFAQPRADVPQVTIDQRQRGYQPPQLPQFQQRQFQPQPPAQVQQRPDRPDFRADRREDRRDFRADQRDDRRDFRVERRDDRQDFRQDRRDFRNGVTTAPQFRDQRQDFRADRRDDRRDFRSERRDDRQDFRRDFRNDQRRDFRGQQGFRGDFRGQPNFRGDGRFGNGYRGGWNRDWRRDSRWNWQSYRSSNRNIFRLPRYYAPYGWNYGYQRFGIGFQLNYLLFDQRYWINDPYYYRLPVADYPYEWVRYYGDALLVDVETGEVVDVVYDIFY